MVTKPTGRDVRRPRKAAVPKLPSGIKGRPKKPIETDPDRYLYVEIQSLISYHVASGTGVSANRVAETVLGYYYGTLVTTEPVNGPDRKPLPREDNIKAMAEGRPFRIYALPKRGGLLLKGGVGYGATEWRNENIFHSKADDMLRKLRALRANLNQWLMIMDDLVNICWSRTSEDPAVVERCRKMADSIGERRKFEKKMLPLLKARVFAYDAGNHAMQLEPGFLSDSPRAKKLGKQ